MIDIINGLLMESQDIDRSDVLIETINVLKKLITLNLSFFVTFLYLFYNLIHPFI